MPVFNRNPNKKPAFYLRSGNVPAFKMIGSSPLKTTGHGGTLSHTHEEVTTQGDTRPSTFQRETVKGTENLTREQQQQYNVQISKARADYRLNMPTVHKGSKRSSKRRKFAKDYMSKFVAPKYEIPSKQVAKDVTPSTVTLNAPQNDELTRFYHGSKSANIGSAGYGERGDEPGLGEARIAEIGDWISFGGRQGGVTGTENITVPTADWENRNDSTYMAKWLSKNL